MKLLLYCTKAKPYLIHESGDYDCDDMCCSYNNFAIVDKQNLYNDDISLQETLNGKIVAECDFEVEKYLTEKSLFSNELRIVNKHLYEGVAKYSETEKMLDNLLKQSCLNIKELTKYMGTEISVIIQKDLYAIHIKNLVIYDEPKELREYCYGVYPRTNSIIDQFKINDYSSISVMYECDKAPKNMARVFTWDWNEGKSDDTYVLISVKPEELCRILNEEQTILLKKRVLKEME